MAIASSSPMNVITDLVETCQLNSYFETFVSGRDLSRSKPAPDIFLLAAKKLMYNLKIVWLLKILIMVF